MHHVAVLVAENLHLDVLGARNVALQENRRITKCAPRLALRFIQQRRQFPRTLHHPHAATAPPKRRLDHQWKADLFRNFQGFPAVRHRFSRPRQRRHAHFLRQCSRGGFIAHQAQQLCLRAHKGDPCRGAGFRELGVFRQKPIAGMNEIHALFLRQRNNAGNVQIRAHRPFAHANQVRLVRLEAMNGQPVLLRVNRHGPQPKLRGRAENANGNLAPIGDKQFTRQHGRGWCGRTHNIKTAAMKLHSGAASNLGMAAGRRAPAGAAGAAAPRAAGIMRAAVPRTGLATKP